jgi:hypothetical protein
MQNHHIFWLSLTYILQVIFDTMDGECWDWLLIAGTWTDLSKMEPTGLCLTRVSDYWTYEKVLPMLTHARSHLQLSYDTDLVFCVVAGPERYLRACLRSVVVHSRPPPDRGHNHQEWRCGEASFRKYLLVPLSFELHRSHFVSSIFTGIASRLSTEPTVSFGICL